MSASASPEALHNAYLCLGSNIHPAENLVKAVALLREYVPLRAFSTCWETEAVPAENSPGREPQPNFLNAAVCVSTSLAPAELKTRVLAPIEQALGRVRTADKYAPRTIDLDITLYDRQVIDPDLWKRDYMLLIFSELLPDLTNPDTGETLREAASRRLPAMRLAIPHPEIQLIKAD